jgi:hypothetical protein
MDSLQLNVQGIYHMPHATVKMCLTYPEEPPALLRGPPVSPSPMRGTAAENERVKTARLAVLAERMMD